jgi:cobalt-zinc-cadmium efflux system outer membrane protein
VYAAKEVFVFCMRVRLVLSLFLSGMASDMSAQSVALTQMQSLALQNHPAGLEAEALTRLGHAEVSRARTWEDPSLRISSGTADLKDSGSSGRENGWEVSQDIPSPLAYSHRVRAARYTLESLEAEAKLRRLELAFRVEVLYVEYAAALERRQLAAENRSDAEKIFDIASRRVELGEARETERIRGEVELLRAQRALAQAERDAEVFREALRRIVGTGLPREFSAEPLRMPPEVLPGSELLQTRLAERNPELRAAFSEALRASEASRAAAWGVLPDLTAGYYDNREVDKRERGFVLSFRIPLWNAKRPEVARSRAEESLANARAKRRSIDLANELDLAYREFHLAARQAGLFRERLLPAARETLRLSRLAYEEGETSFLDLLDAQRTFRETTADSVAVQRQTAMALAEIRRLTGGANEETQ